MATTAPSVTLSPVAINATSRSAGANASQDTGQVFGRVLERHMVRQESQKDVQTKESASENTDSSVDKVVAEDPNAALSWLLMLQQQARIDPMEEGAVEDVLEDADAHSGDDLLRLMQSGTGKGNLSDDTLQEDADAQSALQPNQRVATLPLTMATMSTAAGKNLPQVLGEAVDGINFSDMLINKQVASSADTAQSFLSMGQFDGRRVEPGITTLQSGVTQHVVPESISDSRWGEVVAQRVSLMLGRQEQKIEMQLNPPELGPMEVKLTLGSDQASVVFASQHAGVRDALAAATPRLTALLAEQGIHLVNVQVSSDSLQQQAQEQAKQQSGFMGQNTNSTPHQATSVSGVLADVGALAGISLPVSRSGVSLYV